MLHGSGIMADASMCLHSYLRRKAHLRHMAHLRHGLFYMSNIYFMIFMMVVSYFYMTFSQFLGYFS